MWRRGHDRKGRGGKKLALTDHQRAVMAATSTTPAPAVQARHICTSEDCPMARMLEAIPNLCELEPPKCTQPQVAAEDRALLAAYGAIRPYHDSVWGPASWTALEADILSLPDELDEHEFCMFRIYLALRARYLSCAACALHFEAAIKAMPNDAVHRTRAGLLRWLCGVHNDVNRRKQRAPLPEREILDLLRAKEGGEDKAASTPVRSDAAPEPLPSSSSAPNPAVPSPPAGESSAAASSSGSGAGRLVPMLIAAGAVFLLATGTVLVAERARRKRR
jgi:hypothetical protein